MSLIFLSVHHHSYTKDDGLNDTTLLLAVMLFIVIGIIILTADTLMHPKKYQETLIPINGVCC